MEQRRASIRQRSFIGARIIYGARTLTMDCLIRDLSETGARLVFADRPVVGERFELEVPQKQWQRPVEVIWRAGREIGIVFEDRPSEGVQDAAADRVKKLERANAQLRQKIEILSIGA